MTDYRLFPSTSGPSTSISSGSSFVFGISFEVTSPGLQFEGWWWWVASDGQTTDPQDFALWQQTGNGTATYISGSKTTSGTLSPGWNFIPIGTPIALANGQSYRAVCSATPGGGGKPFSDTAGYFTNAAPGGNGIVNGPLTAFSDGVTGGTNKDPTGTGQMTNFAGGTDVTANYPATTSHSLYWLDVQAGTAAPPASPGGLLMASFP